MERSMGGLFDKLTSNIWYAFLHRLEKVRLIRTTPTLILIPEAICTLRAMGLYLAVCYRVIRLTATRSGKTAFYGLICWLQTYAVLLRSRIFIRLRLDYFLTNALPQAYLYWELWTNSISPSDKSEHLQITQPHPSKITQPIQNAILWNK